MRGLDLGALDAAVFRSLHGGLSATWVIVMMTAFTILGSGWSLVGLVPFLVRPATRRVTRALLVTLVSTSIIVALLKWIVGRARPCACLEGIHARVFTAPTDASFPSGHAAGAFAFAAFVTVVLVRSATDATRPRRRLVGLGLFGLAGCVALSRIALGVHFPVDVSVGAAIGALLGTVGAGFHLRREAAEGKSTEKALTL